jgi:hypothetical protein
MEVPHFTTNRAVVLHGVLDVLVNENKITVRCFICGLSHLGTSMHSLQTPEEMAEIPFKDITFTTNGNAVIKLFMRKAFKFAREQFAASDDGASSCDDEPKKRDRGMFVPALSGCLFLLTCCRCE